MSQRHDTTQDGSTESGRIPEPPHTWYPLGTIFNVSSQGETSATSKEGSSSNQSRGRGPALLHDSLGRIGGKIQITLNERGQPIMSETSALATHLGVLARDGSLLPLHYVDWRYVPEHYKKKVWEEIKAYTTADESMKKWFMQSVGKKWAGWKCEAKKRGYTTYNNDPDRLANRPNRVTEQQWRCLVYHWGDRQVQAKSLKNQVARSKQEILHTTGRTPHYLVEQQEINNKKNPTRIDMYIKTHTKKTGEPVNEATGIILEKLKALQTSDGGSNSTSNSENAMLCQVIGPERLGRVRGYGLGVTPTQLNHANKQNQTSTQDMHNQAEELNKVKSKMKKMEQAFLAMGFTFEDTDDDPDESLPHNNPPDASSAYEQLTIPVHLDNPEQINMSPQLQVEQPQWSEIIRRSDPPCQPVLKKRRGLRKTLN